MGYYTYVLFSPSRYQYYIGQSHESPEFVVNRHNAGLRIATQKSAPWELVYVQQFENSYESYLLMCKLQMMRSRKYLQYYINCLSPNVEVCCT